MHQNMLIEPTKHAITVRGAWQKAAAVDCETDSVNLKAERMAKST